MKTLKQIGTPWAQMYLGSGRLSGHLAETPTYTQKGSVADNWVNVGDMTEGEFWEEFTRQEHSACHSGRFEDCPECN